MGLVRQPELYRCGVAWVAVADPLLQLKGSWWIDDDISDGGRQYLLPELVGDPEKDLAMLTANSPLAQAARIQAPLLLAFGESDRRVPLAHGERLRDALRAAGRPPARVGHLFERGPQLAAGQHAGGLGAPRRALFGHAPEGRAALNPCDGQRGTCDSSSLRIA